jgi:hypothetical protein
VRANLEESTRVTLSAAPQFHILADQKVYGLWGLYSVPSRTSGLLDSDPPRITPPARELVEKVYIPILTNAGIRNGDQIVALLAEKAPRVDLDGKHQKLTAAVAKILRWKLLADEQRFYRDHLLHGGPEDLTRGLQRQLAELIEIHIRKTSFELSPATIRALSKEAVKKGKDGERLAEKLDRIHTAESVLAPTSRLFGYLLGCADTSTEKIVQHIRTIWGPSVRTINVDAVKSISAELGGDSNEAGARWVKIAQCMANGDYGVLIDLVVEQNRTVMAARGGNPWVVKAGKKLDIRFRDDDVVLPDKSKLSSLWQFPYFIDSLHSIARAVNGGTA